MLRTALLAAALCAGVVSAAFGQDRHNHGTFQSGDATVAFSNSGATAAQEPFLRGLALLHSFEYEGAAAAFQEAQKIDEAFALAYWLEAFTYSHILWGEDDPLTARETMGKLGADLETRLARAGTTRERQYGAAIEAFYSNTDLPTRTRAFADSIRRIAAHYPDDIDAAAFSSLALQMLEYTAPMPADERRAMHEEAITIAERVYRQQPRHPGAVHYLIHATDDPALATRGLGAARTYALMAPASEHALHVPSHIFLQLGLWDDVIAANERAWAASRAQAEHANLTGADVGFHDLQWLQYGYLQSGRIRAARSLVDTARNVLADVDLTGPLHVDGRYAITILQFMYAAHTGDWTGAACRRPAEALYQQTTHDLRERAFNLMIAYQAAVSAAECADTAAPAIQFVRKQASALPDSDRSKATFRNAQLHADAILAQKRGNYAQAIALLNDVGTTTRGPSGPPTMLRTEELLGEALLKNGQPREAVAAFTRALQLTPNRASALLGLARARSAAGDRAGAALAYQQLLANWRQADEELAELAEVRNGAENKQP